MSAFLTSLPMLWAQVNAASNPAPRISQRTYDRDPVAVPGE